MTKTLAACALLAGLGAGCNTAVGNYFANRARDFGECFRVEAHVGPNLGASVKAAGLVHLGLQVKVGALGGGWVYGRVWPGPGLVEPTCVPMRGEVFFGIHGEGGRVSHRCYGFLPFVFREDSYSHGLYTPDDDPEVEREREKDRRRERKGRLRWADVHAFDIEVSATAFVGLDLGFSPGEFVDFLVGWFGLDLAGDDRALPELETFESLTETIEKAKLRDRPIK